MNLELLEEAKRRYPIGTKFRVVHLPQNILTVKNHDEYEFITEDIIALFTEEVTNDCSGGCVYNKGKWAEIVSLSDIKIINQDYKYLIKFFKRLNIC
jgi:hypothetical protein